MSLNDTIDAIDALTEACVQCNGPRGDSPSDDFCSETCQSRWLRSQLTESGPSLGVDPVEWRAASDEMYRRLRRFFERYAEEVIPAWSEAFIQLGDAMRGAAPSFVVFDEGPEESPQQRALRLQQTRNVGPRRERYAKRGTKR